MEKSLQEKLEQYYTLISNGVSIEEININLSNRGFKIGELAIFKETNNKHLVTELLETTIHVYRYEYDDSIITDPDLYHTLNEYRDIKISNIIKKEL